MQNRALMGSPRFSLTGSMLSRWIMHNCVLMGSPCFSPTVGTWSCWINAQLCAHGISLFLTHREYVISLDQCRIVCSCDLPLVHSVGMWSRWINAELYVHGIFLFFIHREYVISLDWCRTVCSWDLPVFHPQKVRDFVGSMQNCVLIWSPRFSPTVGTWRWTNVELYAHGTSLFFHLQRVRDPIGSMQNRILMRSPHVPPTGSMWSFRIKEESCAYRISLFFTHRKYVSCRIVAELYAHEIPHVSPWFHLKGVCDLVGSM